jgi:hypothetical protein
MRNDLHLKYSDDGELQWCMLIFWTLSIVLVFKIRRFRDWISLRPQVNKEGEGSYSVGSLFKKVILFTGQILVIQSLDTLYYTKKQEWCSRWRKDKNKFCRCSPLFTGKRRRAVRSPATEYHGMHKTLQVVLYVRGRNIGERYNTQYSEKLVDKEKYRETTS